MPVPKLLQRVKSLFTLSRKATQRGRVTLTQGAEYFYSLLTSGSSNFLKDTTTLEGQAYAYNYSSAVNMIINRKVRAHINGIWSIEDSEGNEASKQVPEIERLLQRPNPLQSFAEFNAQQKLLTQVFGECLILPVLSPGFNRTETSALWIIPNWMWKVKRTGKFFQQTQIEEIITHYEINNNQGTSLKVLPSEVIHVRDLSIPATTNNDEIFNGQSRLFALKWAVWNIHAAMEARNVMITRRGAIGILTNEASDVHGMINLDPKEKKEIQDTFQDYGLSRDQWQIIITNAQLKWQSMVLPTKDLMLFEEVEGSTIQIADAYGYPTDLLGTGGSKKTYENVPAAEKGLYTNSIIPESLPFAEGYTNWLLAGTGLEFKIKYDHLEIFKKALKDEAAAIEGINKALVIPYKERIITKEEWRMIMGHFIDDDFGFDAEKPKGETLASQPNVTMLQLTPRDEGKS